MAEETENSGGSLKSILIGLASTIALGIGGYVTKTLTGEGDEPAAAVSAPAPVINITNSNQQSQRASSGGGTKIIERVVEKPAAQPAAQAQPKPKKKEGDEFKEEAPKW